MDIFQKQLEEIETCQNKFRQNLDKIENTPCFRQI